VSGPLGWKHVLRPLTPLYRAAVRGRAAAYARGWLAEQRLELPVVSVGNLTFGGTGKTPTVCALARDLVRRGRQPAVLTRGYGRSNDDQLVLLGPDHGRSAAEAGDEPLELAERLPGVPIVVDQDRARGGRRAQTLGADLLILDDGFQHLRLGRDLDLVLVDAGDPWGGGQLPPRGRLREPVTALRRADAVLVTKLPRSYEQVLAVIRARVQAEAADIPVWGARFAVSRVLTVGGWKGPEALDGAEVFAMAGVGRPEGFTQVLSEAGARVLGARWFPDHHVYAEADLEAVSREAAELGAVVVTTRKDAVKLPAGHPWWIVEADIRPVAGSWNGLWELLP
jgi:tetraacyldisaccharide 4'-kinase